MFSGVEYLYHDLVYKGQGCYWKGFTKKVGYDRRLKNNFYDDRINSLKGFHSDNIKHGSNYFSTK